MIKRFVARAHYKDDDVIVGLFGQRLSTILGSLHSTAELVPV